VSDSRLLSRPSLRWALPRLFLGTLLSGLFLSGCSSFNLNSINPFVSSSGPKMAELKTLPAAAPANVLWRENLGKAGNYVLTPAIVGNAVYLASVNGAVLRVEEGAVRWRINAEHSLSGGVGSDGDLVVVGSPKGDVLAFDAKDGSLRWKAQASSDILAPPALGSGLVIVRSGDNRLFAFDASDGKRKWIYQRPTPALSLRGFAAPLVADRYVFSGFPGGKLVAVTVNNGALAWEGTVAIPKGATELDRIADISSAPVIVDNMLCAVAYQGRLACFDLTSGSLMWTRDISSATGIAIDRRYVYVADEKGTVHCLERATGNSVWKQDALFYRSVSAPAVLGDSIAVGDVQGIVHFLSRSDGAFVARVATDGGAIVAPPQNAGGKALVQTQNGGVFLIDAP